MHRFGAEMTDSDRAPAAQRAFFDRRSSDAQTYLWSACS